MQLDVKEVANKVTTATLAVSLTFCFGWQKDQDLPLSRDGDKMFVQGKLKANFINL